MWTVSHTPQTNAPYRHVSIITVWQSSQIGKKQERLQTDTLASHSHMVDSKNYSLQMLYHTHTVSQKKDNPLMFDNNFGKCGPIFKILSPCYSWENFLCIYTKSSISPAIYFHTTLWNSKIQKVTKFSCWMWQLTCLTKICCEILRNLPHKYCTYDFTWVCVQHMEYSVERTKTVQR